MRSRSEFRIPRSAFCVFRAFRPVERRNIARVRGSVGRNARHENHRWRKSLFYRCPVNGTAVVNTICDNGACECSGIAQLAAAAVGPNEQLRLSRFPKALLIQPHKKIRCLPPLFFRTPNFDQTIESALTLSPILPFSLSPFSLSPFSLLPFSPSPSLFLKILLLFASRSALRSPLRVARRFLFLRAARAISETDTNGTVRHKTRRWKSAREADPV